MNRYFLYAIIAAIVCVILTIPLFSDQLANAKTIKKIQFTQTITSTEDPGQGHSNEQMAMILQPNNGSIYYGTITYSASEPVQAIIFHQISKEESKGQPTWTVDGNSLYAQTIIDSNSAGSTLDFTGTALGLHSSKSDQFTVTVSFDGWIRTTNPEAIQNNPPVATENYTIRLVDSLIPVKIPLRQGFSNGKPIYYIVTDSSNNVEASQISDKQNWKVQLAPGLAHLPSISLGNMFVFTNGIVGNGTRGFQDEVFSSTPSDKQYFPLSKEVQVTWNIGRSPEILNSTQQILDANMTGRIRLVTTDTIMNVPQIVWPSGQMNVRTDKLLSDQSSYSGGQLLDINTSNMTVTFVGHRDWGSNGQTIYYIVTSGTPQGPAEMMGIQYTPTLLTITSSARDLYHFTNGFAGTGPFGYQEGITSTQPGDSSYIPLCKVSLITWKEPQNAKVLQNIKDIDSEKSIGNIKVEEALVLNKNYILDCPIIENP